MTEAEKALEQMNRRREWWRKYQARRLSEDPAYRAYHMAASIRSTRKRKEKYGAEGARLKELRRAVGLTAQEVADANGVTFSTINSMENARTVPNIEKYTAWIKTAMEAVAEQHQAAFDRWMEEVCEKHDG